MTTTKVRIGLKEVRALPEGGTLWDPRIPGFCARRRGSPSVFYAIKYRNAEGRQRWHTIGRHGAPWTPDAARDEARRILSEVVRGLDPAAVKQARRRGATVADLCEEYFDAASDGRLLTRQGSGKKPGTLATDRSRIDAHIKPLLGDRKVPEVTRLDIEKFMHDVAAGKTRKRSRLAKPRAVSIVKGGKGAATRTVGLLGAIFTYAVRRGLRPDNPVVGVVRFADGKRDRRLSDTEYRQLGDGLASAGVWPIAATAIRFLALTGWRTGEVLGLRWRDVDLERRTARLSDTKTGASVRPLSRSVVRDLRTLSREGPDYLLFHSIQGRNTKMGGFPSLFRKVADAGGLPRDVTPHVLRHSLASTAGDLGFSELTIGALIGHRGGSITSRYVHHADAVLLAAADEVSARISGLMDGMDEERTTVLSIQGREST